MFDHILIANRGEIARRIARTCRRMHIKTLAVYSDADAQAVHLFGADKAVRIGPASAAESYLNQEKLIAVAKQFGCDAIHPGYGFLSENPAFASKVAEAGLCFIGPTPDVIDQMGDKARAKAIMKAAGVPVVPGSETATEDPVELEAMVEAVGRPALLKPAAGGGGKGMTIIREEDCVADAAAAAIRIARSAFGDGRILVERYVEAPRHIEVQVFGDRHSNLVHMFERECSIQRRHQKIIEEAPASALPDEIRARLCDAAIRGARAIGYQNAGTFEFILAPDGSFYFLEVNTRLQVEHPVTECITGLDLVEWQIRVAAGETLPLTQEEIKAKGHAIEARIYAEDPEQAFRPAPGRVVFAKWPTEVRVETAIESGSSVGSSYDPMVGKIVCHGDSRSQALTRLRDAIRDTELLGLTSNLAHLDAILSHPEMVRGAIDTGFLDRCPDLLLEGKFSERAVAAFLASQAPAAYEIRNPWLATDPRTAADRRNLQTQPHQTAHQTQPDLGSLVAEVEHEKMTAVLLRRTEDVFECLIQDRPYTVEIEKRKGNQLAGTVAGIRWSLIKIGAHVEVQVGGVRRQLKTERGPGEGAESADPKVRAPLPGTITVVRSQVGDHVQRGSTLAILEAMKMEIAISAPISGLILSVGCEPLANVVADQILFIIEPIAHQAA